MSKENTIMVQIGSLAGGIGLALGIATVIMIILYLVYALIDYLLRCHFYLGLFVIGLIVSLILIGISLLLERLEWK